MVLHPHLRHEISHCTTNKRVSPIKLVYLLQYYEELGKPTPKVEVMKFLKKEQYEDAKDFAGECESVVMIAKGQSKFIFTLSRCSMSHVRNTFLNLEITI